MAKAVVPFIWTRPVRASASALFLKFLSEGAPESKRNPDEPVTLPYSPGRVPGSVELYLLVQLYFIDITGTY